MKNIITIIFILISISSYCQDLVIKKNEIAGQLYQKGQKYEALLVLKEILKDYPKSKLRGPILFNIPMIYQQLDSTELAIKWYNKILEDKHLSDSERNNSRGLFETHTNYKYNASLQIGFINYNNKNYSEALKYYKLAYTHYPYYNDSGTTSKLKKIKLASNISDCYLQKDKIDSSIVVLLPHALTKSPTDKNFASDKIIQIIKKYNRESLFKAELVKSLENLNKTSEGVILTCYGIEVEMYPYFGEKFTKEYLKNTELYKKISELP